ncbi:ATP-dependent DNA helicase [Ottowia sp. GY511]|uniref:ATP-dependent DNA helicase n=1 Tax=Ottowia flava TaxID=2675430 RepID=A0ABW4KUI7_9BURK|nr:ATP-dependent DNA helicase [Ottowia sp. GY511]TXK33675.1 ATP-dependent DNA helicase [Ottowia sp. GY511]
MTSLEQAVAAAFAPDGALACAADGFREREGQTRLALAIARTVEQGGELVAEAATGVGKTFAYLVPALLSGERVLLSTATKALQDQLFARDLPQLAAALGVPVRMALLKGRASYLCRHRMNFAEAALGSHELGLRVALGKVARWAQATRTGDLGEMPGLDERSPVIPLVTSTRENCLGAECPQFRQCHVNQARRDAMAADVVVINHHLFFADMAVRESGMAELLPTVRVVVFDEAHQLNETGVQFLGRHLATGQLLDFARDLLAAGLQHARGLADWLVLAGDVERAARDLRMAAGPAKSTQRLRWTLREPDGVDRDAWALAIAGLGRALALAERALAGVAETAPDLARLQERAGELGERTARFSAPGAAGFVRWLDVAAGLRLIESPLDIAEAVQTKLLTQPAEAVGRRAWVFVSATLGADERLTWFTGPCGLENAEVLQIGSPFDYARQAALYVPEDIARPADAQHSGDVARLAGDIAERLGGRTLVLTTTLRALRAIGEVLALRFGERAGPEVLLQGTLPKRVLMDRFRAAAGDALGRGCVLVGSASFWEGVDMPGDALQCVVIDKLPFPPPGDPLVEARCQRLEDQGRSAFAAYSVPAAAVALKQGAGRLIRRETDAGLLVICDTRLLNMGYGRRLLAALPPMPQLAGPADLAKMLDRLVAQCQGAPAVEN